MESVYDPKPFKASERIAVDDYFQSYKEICNFGEPLLYSNEILDENNDEEYLNRIKLEMDMDLSHDNLRELGNRCSISKLTLDDEPNNIPMEIPSNLRSRTKFQHTYPMNNNARQLNVVICLGVLENKYKGSDFTFANKRFIKTATVTPCKSVLCNMMPGSNFIYNIIVYRPFSINYYQRNSQSKLRFGFEIEALGTNNLAEIADQICCIFKEGLFREVENTKVDLTPLMNAKEHYPSQTMFIDGVLYNDLRAPHAIDYSAPIIRWVSEKNIGTFTSDLLETTVLNTLKPRLGYPYVYMHQGNCEHLFTFSDARLLQPGDCLDSKKFPRISTITKQSTLLCFICGVTNGQWIVLGCEKLPHERMFLCTECCDSYLYVDGKKVTDFKLYPYYDQDMLTNRLSVIIAD